MTDKKNLFIVIGLSSLLIITASLGYYINSLGILLNRSDPIDTNLIYDLEKGDYLVFNSSQSQSMIGNISMGGEYYVMYQNGTWDYLRMRSITNNTIYTENSVEYCNVSFDQSIGLLKYNFSNNEIIDMEDDETFKIRMEIPIAMKIENYAQMMYINMTSGNATDIQFRFDSVEWGSIFDDELGNTTIELIDYEGNSYYGIQIGDTFDILPLDNSSIPEAVYYPEIDTNFLHINSNEMITNATLGGLFQQPLAFPIDVTIDKIIQNGSGLIKTFVFMISGSEDLNFGNFFTDNEWIIEESYNSTLATIYSDRKGGYTFTYIENGYNDTEDVQYNLTISIAFNMTFTERNILDNFIASINMRDVLSNRTTNENLFTIQMEMGIQEDLVYSNLHYNDIILEYDDQVLINEDAEINITIDDERITALLYSNNSLLPPILLNTFSMSNKTFNVSYAEAGIYDFILEIYHNEELNDTIEFSIEFYQNVIPDEQIEWYWLAITIGTIVVAIAVVFIYNRE